MSHFFRLALFALGALIAAPAFADITIGQVLTLTGPGAEAGREIGAGARAYIDKINAAGGVDGHKIIYVAGDDGGQPALTLVRASELMARPQMFGLLAGGAAQAEAIASSGALRQQAVPMLAIRQSAASPAATRAARQAGLIEVVSPQDYAEHLQREFAAVFTQYGPGDMPASPLALQGYATAKALVGAVQFLGPNPTRAEFFRLMQMLPPNVGSRLVTLGYIAD